MKVEKTFMHTYGRQLRSRHRPPPPSPLSLDELEIRKIAEWTMKNSGKSKTTRRTQLGVVHTRGKKSRACMPVECSVPGPLFIHMLECIAADLLCLPKCTLFVWLEIGKL